jgi:hypothetical protein
VGPSNRLYLKNTPWMPHGLCPLVLCLAHYTLLRVTRRSFDFAHVGSHMAIHT